MRPYGVRRGTANAAILVAVATEQGMSTDACLRGTGIARAALDDPDAEISTKQELDLICSIVGALGSVPGLGLRAGRDVHSTAYGVFGLGLVSSATIRSALRFALRNFELSYTLAAFSVAEEQDRFVARFDYPAVTPAVERFLFARDATVYTSFFREALARPARPLAMTCLVPTPETPALYESALGVRPRFGAAANTIAFDRRLLDFRLPLANSHTAALCERLCRELVGRRRQADTLANRVRRALGLTLVRDEPLPPPRDVAAALYMSTRSLRRELLAEGTSFRHIAEEVAADFARRSLQAGSTIDDVARRLGYSEASSFSRAFKRWTGMSPSALAAARPALVAAPGVKWSSRD